MPNAAYDTAWNNTLQSALVVPKLQRRTRKSGQYFATMTYLV